MTITVPVPPGNPAHARRAVRSALTEVPSEVTETAALLASELVTNAFVHGSGDATLFLDVGDRFVRIEVFDRDPSGELASRAVDVTSPHGRGLAIVEALASSWGVVRRDDGKTVWCELVF